LRRVLFVNRFFHPDHSATSQIASDLAFHLASRGWEVHAIASRQLYDDAQARLPRRDSAKGVHIERIWSTRFGRAGLAGRAIDYLTFYLSAFFAIRRQRQAIVIAMTDPPLLSVVAAAASRSVVNWVQDLFPEVAEALGIRVPFVKRLRDWSLRGARANVVLGELMAARVANAAVIPNWADAGLRPVAASPHEGFVVAYSGNLGRAHEFESIMKAMHLLPHVRFVFTGGGAQLESVKRDAPANAEFRPYVPREELSRSLSAADAHLVSLRPELEGLIVPSKFYGVLAVARPVIFIGARDGELARIIERERCGVVVAAGDGEGLAGAIEMLARDRDAARAMGERGRQLYLHSYAPEHAFAAWERVLEDAAR
jgi:colanic acid biosynthesis glycosyl transferase WcaI